MAKKNQINITDKYGACVQLKVLLETMQKEIIKRKEKNEVIPGYEYLYSKIFDLYRDLNNEIFEYFSGTINGINKIVQDIKDDTEGSSPYENN